MDNYSHDDGVMIHDIYDTYLVKVGQFKSVVPA